jgi:hypothetical protein
MRTLAPAAGAPSGPLMVPRTAEVVSCANPATDTASKAIVAKSARPTFRNDGPGKCLVFVIVDPRDLYGSETICQQYDSLISLGKKFSRAAATCASTTASIALRQI